MNSIKYLFYKQFIKIVVLILSILLLSFTISCSKSSSNSTNKSSNVKIHKIEDYNIDNSIVGLGYSTLADEQKATKEIFDQLSITKNPTMLILYASPDYQIDKILPLIKSRFNKAVIFGSSTRDKILTNDGIVQGKKGSMAMLSFQAENLKVSSAAKPFENNPSLSDIHEITHHTIDEAVLNTKLDNSKKPKLVYMSCSAGYEEIVIEELIKYFGENTQIFGGTASTSSLNLNKEMPSFIIGNGTIYKSGVSILLVYDGVKIGSEFKSGFINFAKEKTGIITSCEKNSRIIKTINNLPASDVYNEWTDNIFADEIKKGDIINNSKTQYLMTRNLGDSGENVLTAVIQIDPKSKTIVTAANLVEGQKVNYIEANKEILINRTKPLVTGALLNGNLKKSDSLFGMFNICSGAMRYIDTDAEKICTLINNELGSTPWIGFVSQGEQGTIKNHGSFHGNFMSSIVVFGKN